MEKSCNNCAFEKKPLNRLPCSNCGVGFEKWKPKEDKMGEKTFTMTFTTDASEEELKKIEGSTGDLKVEASKEERLEEANEMITELTRDLEELKGVIAYKNGEIDGLKYAIRHFGIKKR